MNIIFFSHKYFRYIFIVIFSIIIFQFLFFTIIAGQEFTCDDFTDQQLTNAELDQIIKICNAEIKQQEGELKVKQKETSGVKHEIRNLDRKIRISRAYINTKIARANKLNKNINDNKQEIKNLEVQLEETLISLSNLIKIKHKSGNYTKVEIIFSAGTFSDFFSNIESIKILQQGISEQVTLIKKEKVSLKDLSIELEERESAERILAAKKENETKKINNNKAYKGQLLSILKKEEGEYKKQIQGTKEIKQKILRRKFALASGVKISFGDALAIIQPYEDKFKMDSAFVLSILFQESGWGGKIGGNIGRCTFNQKNYSGNVRGGFTVMRSTQKSNFLKIMADLGRDPNTQKISCPIPRDGAFGGAMGPAQFMPNTWMGVREAAGRMLGIDYKKLSPFVNHHAFIASATYLKRQYYSRSCTYYANKYAHISSERTLRERCAGARYYAGGH